MRAPLVAALLMVPVSLAACAPAHEGGSAPATKLAFCGGKQQVRPASSAHRLGRSAS